MLGRDFAECARRGEAAVVAWSHAGPRWNDPGVMENSGASERVGKWAVLKPRISAPFRLIVFRGSSWKEKKWLICDAFEMHIRDLVVVGVDGCPPGLGCPATPGLPGACERGLLPLLRSVLQPWPLSHREN